MKRMIVILNSQHCGRVSCANGSR